MHLKLHETKFSWPALRPDSFSFPSTTKGIHDIRFRINIFFVSVHFVAFPSGVKVPCPAITREIEASDRREPYSEWELKLHPRSHHVPFDLSLPLREGRSVSWPAIQTIKGNGPREEHRNDKWLIKNTFSPSRPPLPRPLPPRQHQLYGNNLSLLVPPAAIEV